MRVLLTSPVLPPELGGPAVYTASLARWLAERGHAVRVIGYGPRAALYFEDGCETRLVRRTSVAGRYLRMTAALQQELAWADVAFSSDHLCAPLAFALRRTRKPGVLRIMIDPAWELSTRFGWTESNPDEFRTGEKGWRGRLVAKLQVRWWRRFARLVLPSDYLQRVVLDYGAASEKCVRIDNPFHGRIDATSAKPRQRNLILLVARHVAWKRIDWVIREFDAFPEDWRLEIAGDGPERAKLEALARTLGSRDRIRFLGALDHIDVLDRMSRASLLILPSSYEGLSHTLLEAMALSLPVAATDVAGNRELLRCGDHGLQLPEDLSVRLAAVIPPWFESGRAARGAKAAREVVRVRHDRDHVFAEVERILLQLARDRSSADSGDLAGRLPSRDLGTP